MANIYIIDEYQERLLKEQVENAKTLEELKEAIIAIIDILPTEHQYQQS